MARNKIISVRPKCPKCKAEFVVDVIHVDFIHSEYAIQLTCIACGEEVTLQLGLDAFIKLELGGTDGTKEKPSLE